MANGAQFALISRDYVVSARLRSVATARAAADCFLRLSRRKRLLYSFDGRRGVKERGSNGIRVGASRLRSAR